MELKQVVCESTLVVYIEGLVNDYIQKEFSYIDEEEERLYMTVFNFVVSYYSCSQRHEDSIAIRFYIRLAVERNFRYINSALMY
jgi:type IV secretory pathway VirD2 relaxase